jgi:hypothetical protein
MERGRPKKVRLPGSGGKLYAALQLAGLCWGKNGVQANHVCHNSRWQECNLPRSTNTILEDIHAGIPVDRLNDYASFFNVSPRLFSDIDVPEFSSEFSCEILKNKYIMHSSSAVHVHISDPIYHYAVASNNEMSYINRLFNRLNGVFDIFIKQYQYEYIQRCVIFVNSLEKSSLQFFGKMWYDGIDLTLTGAIFRWSSFLHITYYTADCHVLGYMLTPDPLQSLLIEGRDPLCLDLFGLAGSLTSPFVPDRYYGFARQRPRQEAENLGTAYEQACRELAEQPIIPAADPTYAAHMARIETVGRAVPGS